MHVLVDGLVDRAQPDLTAAITRSRTNPTDRVDVFDPFRPPAETGSMFARFRPDILIVDPVWFLVTPILTALLELNGCAKTLRVIATSAPDNITKIKTTYHGFYDIIDLDDTPDALVEHLRDIHEGYSRLEKDNLWRLIPRPETLVDITAAPEDEDDVAILELICIGLRDRDIANAVHMSHQTVRNRISRMYERSGLSNRTQMAWMYSNHLLTQGMLANPRIPDQGDRSAPLS